VTYTGVQDQTIRPRTKRWSDSTWLKAIFAELRRTTSSRAQSEHGWRTFDSKPLDVAGGRATALRQRNDDSKQRRRRSGRRRPAEPPPAGWQGAESHCALRFHEKYTHLSEISDPPCTSSVPNVGYSQFALILLSSRRIVELLDVLWRVGKLLSSRSFYIRGSCDNSEHSRSYAHLLFHSATRD